MRTVTTQVTAPARKRTPDGVKELKIESASLVSVATLVTWVFCLSVGAIGLLVPYARPAFRPPESPPVLAQVLNVQLTQEPSPPPPPTTAPPDALLPPPLEQIALPFAPPLVVVAEPLPAVAFPLPIEAPSPVVEPARARASAVESPIQPASAPPMPVQAITYGQGEGRQPAPEYPRRAVLEGQEGVVTIRFSVGEEGRVLNAEAVSPCPWPLLNGAALRVVRSRWRFPAGPPRHYEVAIRFELTK